MTHAASRRRAGSAWILPGIALVLVGVAVLVGWISRSIGVDFLSWWPIWILLVASIYWAKGRKLGPVRLSGLLSIVSVVVIAVFVAGHLQSWSILPSTATPLSGGEDQGVESAALSADLEGDLVVMSGSSEALYSVEAIRRGGSIGLPTALERSQGEVVSVELSAVEEPGWYQFSGWNLELSPGPAWSISLNGEIDADLTELRVDNLQIGGGGRVTLGTVTQGTPVAISGDFVISVPQNQAVRVIGPAEVPADWIHNDTGTTAPTEGQGWVISVPEGSILQIESR